MEKDAARKANATIPRQEAPSQRVCEPTGATMTIKYRYPITHCIGSEERLLIILHYADVAEQVMTALASAATWDDALAIKMAASEAEYLRDAETNVKIRNGLKGGYTRHHNYPQLRKARRESRPPNW